MVEYVSYKNDVLNAIEGAKQRALLTSAILAKGQAILLAPVAEVRGGTLRQSIDYKEDFDNDRILVGSTSKYAVYVEKGTGIYAEDGNGRKTAWVYYDTKTDTYYYTRGNRPQPFLLPSIAKNQKEIVKIFEEELRKLGD